jgi:phage terminase large subunit
MMEIEVALPPKLKPLFSPARYKIAYGGRGSGKSWGFARALLLFGKREPLRILCAREVQRTIADSVHRLLADQIVAMQLEHFYTIQESSITGLNGTEFLFAGLRTQDVAKIKSFEGVDIAWCEEAQSISSKSWSILIPTIRKEGSEIWVTFNPDMDSDDTYQRFVVKPPHDSVVMRMTWIDNRWFPDVLEKERLHLQKTDAEGYAHVWEGKCRTVVEGAIYAGEVTAMIEQRRVRPVPYDPMLKVHTILGSGLERSDFDHHGSAHGGRGQDHRLHRGFASRANRLCCRSAEQALRVGDRLAPSRRQRR